MLQKLKKNFGSHHPIRLFWHKLKAIASNVWFGFPGRKLKVIGVTGTDGKTTTCQLIAAILEKAGKKVGMLSTVYVKIGDKEEKNKTHKTSLLPSDLQRYLRQMVDEGCEYVVIETASHGIAQNRIWGIPYDVVVMTNLTPEHLDYHGTMEHYRDTKARLFRELILSKKKEGVPKTIVVNTDDEYFDHFVQFDAEKKMTYGKKISGRPDVDRHVSMKDIVLRPDMSEITLSLGDLEKRVRLYLPGEFNLYNLLAAVAVTHSLGVELDAVERACDDVRLVPGRMEAIEEGQDFKVFIDFAMTEMGYRNMLSALRPITSGKIWVVFGCCGDRDKGKRAMIGKACAELADRTVVCDDEPYTEDPSVIRRMILSGLEETDKVKDRDYFEIPDRAEAILFACKNARTSDTVVIPGMGDFEGRTFANEVRPWCEREEVKKALRIILEKRTS